MNILAMPSFVSSTAKRRSPARLQPEAVVEALKRHMHVNERRVRSGQHVYQSGQPFHSIYLLRAGSVKTCELAEDGRDQITGFWMRGDLLGVGAIGLNGYPSEATALEDSTLWQLQYSPVLAACLRVPELQMRLTAALAESIRRNRSWMLSIGTLSAEQRVAAFLLDLAHRHGRLGFSQRQFTLRMRRADIASFLALTHETVSRALSHLGRSGLIEIRRHEVTLLDSEALRRLAGARPVLH